MQPFVLVWMLLVPFIASGIAQDLTPSILWKNPNITSSKDERIDIASAALEKAVSMLQPNGQFNDSAYDTPGRLYGQMAEFDRLTNQTKYKQTLQQCFALAESPNYMLNYGYAAARAYAAYQDPDFLDLAVISWTNARRYTISAEQAASGTMDVKQFNLSLSCQGATLAGGTYYSIYPNDTTLNSLASGFVFIFFLLKFVVNSAQRSTSLFLVVSALLAEATSNQTYLNAAIESANFIQSQLLNPSYIVLDYLSSQSNESCSVFSMSYSSDDSGIFIEGLSILADITRNTSTETLLRSAVVAVATDTSWQGLDGIIATTTTGGHYIVRALAALYERNMLSSDLREYIKEYIGVQYNAVIEKATSGGSNIYAMPWIGPPRTSFFSYAQTVGLTALLSAIQLVDDQSPLKSSDSPASSCTPTAKMTTSPSPSKKNTMGAVVGGVVGGLAVLALTIVCVLLCRRRHRQGNHTPLAVDESSSRIPIPFMAMSVPMEITGGHDINKAKNARYLVDANRGQSSTSPGAAETDVTRMDVQTESATPLEAVVSPPNLLHTERREDMPMEELLRLLNQQLLLGRWNGLDDELPPEYSEGRTT
ncbi:hypothetical protein ARMSODRAFT_1025971 [Armillaria solidipes]|uniref:Glycoside hydrolase family 76 protein n=1 Tax=Armillaria solidipes TaxID=1076256 RepID=A0A2H3B1X4_9AGAR|nr:hypothetical protein ARMSODRAFT_1025971 [Armillaria solidipes]